MSFYSYHIYGIGVNVDEVPIDETLLIDAIKASHIKENIAEEFDRIYAECNSDIEQTCDEISEELFETASNGIATIIARLIEEQNPGLCLVDCQDFVGNRYIVYAPDYPWQMNDFDKSLTETKLQAIFIDFLNTITKPTEEITNDIIDYYAVENGE